MEFRRKTLQAGKNSKTVNPVEISPQREYRVMSLVERNESSADPETMILEWIWEPKGRFLKRMQSSRICMYEEEDMVLRSDLAEKDGALLRN